MSGTGWKIQASFPRKRTISLADQCIRGTHSQSGLPHHCWNWCRINDALCHAPFGQCKSVKNGDHHLTIKSAQTGTGRGLIIIFPYLWTGEYFLASRPGWVTPRAGGSEWSDIEGFERQTGMARPWTLLPFLVVIISCNQWHAGDPHLHGQSTPDVYRDKNSQKVFNQSFNNVWYQDYQWNVLGQFLLFVWLNVCMET